MNEQKKPRSKIEVMIIISIIIIIICVTFVPVGQKYVGSKAAYEHVQMLMDTAPVNLEVIGLHWVPSSGTAVCNASVETKRDKDILLEHINSGIEKDLLAYISVNITVKNDETSPLTSDVSNDE